MKQKRLRRIFLFVLFISLCLGGFLLYDRGRPYPVPLKETLYQGIVYKRSIQISPRPIIIHTIIVDMRTPKLRFLVTPPDDRDAEYPLKARTTSQFLEEFDMQIAINGDGFSPWWSRSPVDYYPHVGDPVMPHGDTASRGRVYSKEEKPVPTLYISSRNQLSFDAPSRLYNAISGGEMLVMAGDVVDGLNDKVTHPRTAIGYSRNGRTLYLVVVDGRQPLYSEGMTLLELAQFMKNLGSFYAMNLDGGGSSTMVVQGKNGKPRILNSPIDNYIPGRERPVANHLGIYFQK